MYSLDAQAHKRQRDTDKNRHLRYTFIDQLAATHFACLVHFVNSILAASMFHIISSKKNCRCNFWRFKQRKKSEKYEFICETNLLPLPLQLARRRSVISTHTHTQQIVQIEEKEVCKCTKPPNKSNETFPYQIAVNIQCSLTFSCMCSLFLCVYFH